MQRRSKFQDRASVVTALLKPAATAELNEHVKGGPASAALRRGESLRERAVGRRAAKVTREGLGFETMGFVSRLAWWRSRMARRLLTALSVRASWWAMSASGAVPTRFILSRRPFSKLQRGLIDAEGAALLPDRAKFAAGDLGDHGVREPAQEGEFVFCPWPWFALHGHARPSWQLRQLGWECRGRGLLE